MEESLQNREKILNDLIDTLYTQIKAMRNELKNTLPEKKNSLRRELRSSILALSKLLQLLPEESSMDEWLRIIQSKLPKKMVKHLLEKMSVNEQKLRGKVFKSDQ